MKIKIITYTGDELILDAESFKFRTNHVSNWIKVKYETDTEHIIHDVCVIEMSDGGTM